MPNSNDLVEAEPPAGGPPLIAEEKLLSEKSFDRLVYFSDAVVAIALTLLTMPLVDIMQEVGTQPLMSLIWAHGDQFFAFALSFLIIALYWSSHRKCFENLDQADVYIVRWNLVWLFSIIFLPVPTAAISVPVANAHELQTSGVLLYIATMFVSVLSIRMITAHGNAHPDLLTDTARRRDMSELPVLRGWLELILMTIAFMLSALVPSLGAASLFILWLGKPISALVRKISRERTH